MKPTAYIYTLEHPITGEIRYVGKTSQLDKRLYFHLIDLKHNPHKRNWILSLKRQGLNPVLSVLEEIEDQPDEVWCESERFWIETLKFYGCRLLNMTSGGLQGGFFSACSKTRMSNAKRGVPKSKIHREHMSLAQANMSDEKRAIRKEKSRVAAFCLWARRTPDQREQMTLHLRRIAAARRKIKPPPLSVEERAAGNALRIAKLRATVSTPEWKDKARIARLSQKKPIFTEERKAECAARLKIMSQSPEFQEKRRLSQIGLKRSEETKAKIRAAYTDETRTKMRALKLGVPLSEITRAKMRASRLAYIAKRNKTNMMTMDFVPENTQP